MQRPSKKSLIIPLLAAALAFIAGCTALRFGYNQAPEFAYWWMDAYVDFDDTQSARAKTELAAWFRWHRAEQLPGYAQQLSHAVQQVTEPTTPTQVCRWRDELDARLVPAFEQGLPALADLALTLTPRQIEHVAQRFDKNNAKFKKEHLPADRGERLEAVVERYRERAERLYGRLQSAQRTRLRELVAASPYDPEVWFAERRARQQDLLAALRRLHAERATPAQAQSALRALFASFRESPRAAYRAYNQRLTPYNCQLAAELHNSTTPEQRAAAAKRLRGWQDDLRVLAAAALTP